MTIFSPQWLTGKALSLRQLPEMWGLHLPGEQGYFWTCPPPASRSCSRWAGLARRKQGQGFPGVGGTGSGARKQEDTGAASPPSSPAPEEPQSVRNVNKEETALAKQRPHDNSRPKQSHPGPHPHKQTSQAFVRTQ